MHLCLLNKCSIKINNIEEGHPFHFTFHIYSLRKLGLTAVRKFDSISPHIQRKFCTPSAMNFVCVCVLFCSLLLTMCMCMYMQYQFMLHIRIYILRIQCLSTSLITGKKRIIFAMPSINTHTRTMSIENCIGTIILYDSIKVRAPVIKIGNHIIAMRNVQRQFWSIVYMNFTHCLKHKNDSHCVSYGFRLCSYSCSVCVCMCLCVFFLFPPSFFWFCLFCYSVLCHFSTFQR